MPFNFIYLFFIIFIFFTYYFLPLVFTLTDLLRKCSRVRWTVLPNKPTQSNLTSFSGTRVTMILLENAGMGAYQQSLIEPTETWGKTFKTSLLCWPSLLCRLFFLWWHGHKIKPHQRWWLFLSAFPFLSLIWAATRSRSPFHRETSACSPGCVAPPQLHWGQKDAAGLHYQPHQWGPVTLLPLTSLSTSAIKDAWPALVGG